MSFATFSAPVAAAGAVLLAALLYLLQRLRARRRIVQLPAAALWGRAVEEAPMRVLGARFRYWLAYLLALAIVLALWLAAAHPVPPPQARGQTEQLFYLDASAVLSGGGQAAQAKRALLADVRAVPPGAREVFLGDATGTRLLARGESASLLAARLDGVAAGVRPSAFAGWLRDRVAQAPPGRPVAVRYYGAWPVARDAAAPWRGRVALAVGYLAGAVPDNRGIVALGASPAASGRWDRADVLVEVSAPHGAATGFDALRVTDDGRDIGPASVTDLGAGRLLLRDLPADGGLLAVSLRAADGFPADDRAAIRLPDRRPVRVAMTAAVPPAIRDAVRADDAFAVAAPADAQVIVRAGSERVRPDLPALVLSPASDGATAFRFAGPGEAAGGDLTRRLDAFALARIDAPALADALHRPIGVTVADAPRRTIAAWRELFDDRAGFTRSPALPLFVAQGLRWLAGERAWVPYAKAGEALPDGATAADWSGAASPGGVPGVAPFLAEAGTRDIAGRPVAVSLTDRATTALVRDGSARPSVSPGGGDALPDPLFMALVTLALLLLAGEWLLVRRGWMP